MIKVKGINIKQEGGKILIKLIIFSFTAYGIF